MGFGDFSFSTQLRDAIDQLVANAIERLRPPYRYGLVQTVDPHNRRCTVILNGDTSPVTVNLGSLVPIAINTVVRVSGIGTDRYVDDIIGNSSSMPTGAIIASGSPITPAGWYFCNGGEASRITDKPLFDAIGVYYGAGNGTTTFNIPNFADGRFPFGVGSATFFGIRGGERDHVLTLAESPAHSHAMNAHNHAQDAHNHINAPDGNYHNFRWGSDGGTSVYIAGAQAVAGASGSNELTTRQGTAIGVLANTATNQPATSSMQNAGGGAAHNNMPPYVGVGFYIKY